MAFKAVRVVGGQYPDPEALFADIKQRKSPGLLSQQADIIRKYMNEAIDLPDVSIQLATGQGKTLIGMLVAEWLRKEKGYRILYLCPTKQLANQVAIQSNDQYGIPALCFTGKQSDYASSAKDEYASGAKIAISTYSALFNTNPYFSDPNILIMDDVHQSEGYISSLWSVRLHRDWENQAELFEETLSIVGRYLPKHEIDRIIRGIDEKTLVDKLPAPDFYKIIPELSALYDSKIDSTNQIFSWRMIKNNLHACHCYFSANEVLIRPLYPPTFTFSPFAGAKQRIYMSATLGNGGDLERIVGRRLIYKLPVPEQWSDRTVGRRFFCFPEVSLDDAATASFVKNTIQRSKRAVYIAPSGPRIEEIEKSFDDLPDFEILKAPQIEASKNAFCSQERAILLLANRYDGIDFPDDECRLLIIDGLPKASNIQENFLIAKLGLSSLYQSRLLTRITQAFGRTTRSTSDFSVVMVIGDEIVSYLQKQENRQYLLPELRAEIEFGLEQSRNMRKEDMLENIDIFYKQDRAWKEVEGSIIALRDRSARTALPNSEAMLDIASHEVEYSEAIWHGNYSSALERCKQILGKAIAEEMRGLRGFWNYLAGVSAFHILQQGGRVAIPPEEYFGEAAKAAVAVSWLHRIKNEKPDTDREVVDPSLLAMVDRLEEVFSKLGNRNAFRIDSKIKQILENLSTDSSKEFEHGQVLLGNLLGYESGKVEEDGSPDPWWKIGDWFCIVFEDYTEGLEESALSIRKARQAASHHLWARAKLELSDTAKTYVFIVAKIEKAHRDALIHVDNVAFLSTDEFREFTRKSLELVRELWSTFPGPGELFWKQSAIEKIARSDFSPASLEALFYKNPCKVRLAD